MRKAANMGGLIKGAVIAVAFIVFGLGSSQQAQAQTTTTTVPFNSEQTSPCTGETVSITGQTVIIEQTNISLDGRLHTHFNFNTKGSGVVIQSVDPARIGAKYNFSDMQESDMNGLTFPFEVSNVMHQRLIALAENATLAGGDDYIFHSTVHFTVNATGTPSAFVDNVTLKCQ